MSEHERQSDSLHAAEYVLGTLDGAGRAEIDAALLRGDPDIVAAVTYWEQRLNSLGLALPPIAPPDSVWSRIKRATGMPATGALRDGTDFWRGLAIAASMAALALLGVLTTDLWRSDDLPAFASVIRDEPSAAGWLITANRQTGALEVTSLRPFDKPAEKSLHLWLVPADGEPISLGLMPMQGRRQISVPEQAMGKFDDMAEFVVSLEPPGGSPEPVPTGKIMWTEPVTGTRG